MTLDKKEIAEYIGEIVSETYGVIGLVKPTNSFSNFTLLKKNHYFEGVKLSESGDKYFVDVHVSVLYGLKVTEIVNEIYKRLSYLLKQKYGDVFKKINVFIDNIQEL